MAIDLDMRLALMRNTGMISHETERKMKRLRQLFAHMYGIELTEENASACITHLCMAFERMQSQADIVPLDPMVREEMAAEDDFPVAQKIAEDIFRLVGPLPPQEWDYIAIHIVMVLRHIRTQYDKKILG